MKWIVLIVLLLLAVAGVYYFTTSNFSGGDIPYDPKEGAVSNFIQTHVPTLVNNEGHIYNALGQQIG